MLKCCGNPNNQQLLGVGYGSGATYTKCTICGTINRSPEEPREKAKSPKAGIGTTQQRKVM